MPAAPRPDPARSPAPRLRFLVPARLAAARACGPAADPRCPAARGPPIEPLGRHPTHGSPLVSTTSDRPHPSLRRRRRRPPPRSPTWAALRPLVLRLHFYAGVFVAPFLAVACLTGLVYVFSPQLNDLVYRDQLLVGPHSGPARPLDDQIAAALAAHPEGTLSSVHYPGDPDAHHRRRPGRARPARGHRAHRVRRPLHRAGPRQPRHLVRHAAAADHARRPAPQPAARRARPDLLRARRQLAVGPRARRPGPVDRQARRTPAARRHRPAARRRPARPPAHGRLARGRRASGSPSRCCSSARPA